MAQRISRAKRTITVSGLPFHMPPAIEAAERLRVVLHVLYLLASSTTTSLRQNRS